jgi:signal transduction histidine kinase
MLHEFLEANREKVLERTRSRVAGRTAPEATDEELTQGIPQFFDELVAILRGDEHVSGALRQDATLHGEAREQNGFTVAQVVRDYGDICQVVTELAIELAAPIATEEFRTLNACLDDAIAQAVTEYARSRERSISGKEIERLGVLAHEMRNCLHVASLAYDSLKSGTVAIGGSTGTMLGRSLAALRALIDRSLVQVRLDAGLQHRERIEIASFIEEVEASGSILAREGGHSFSVERCQSGVTVDGDRQLLGAAVSNLLHNAFKFTPGSGRIGVRTSVTPDSFVIEVQDECGGLLRQGQLDGHFSGFQQDAPDRSGLGLGLAISKRAIDAMGGVLRARNLPGTGCIFSIELPKGRRDQPAAAVSHEAVDRALDQGLVS